MEKPIDFWLRKGKAVGKTKLTESNANVTSRWDGVAVSVPSKYYKKNCLSLEVLQKSVGTLEATTQKRN